LESGTFQAKQEIVKRANNAQEREHDEVGASRASPFERFAKVSVRLTGNPLALGIAVGVILIWLLTGPLFGFSDTWQLVINTTTTIVTFLMVFLIQNAQNRDNEAIQLKLDELIRSTEAAHNALLDVEEISESELDRIKMNFGQLARVAREHVRKGRSDQGCPELKPRLKSASHPESPKNSPVHAGSKQKGKD
jgi:low affinity Fe/Cu permease